MEKNINVVIESKFFSLICKEIIKSKFKFDYMNEFDSGTCEKLYKIILLAECC